MITVAAGIEKVLAAQGLTMLIAATGDNPDHEERVVAARLERRVRSLLLVPIAADQSYLDGERQLGTPVVCLRPTRPAPRGRQRRVRQPGRRRRGRTLPCGPRTHEGGVRRQHRVHARGTAGRLPGGARS
jgi:hypothetical protein